MQLDGRAAAKSDRVGAGAWLEVDAAAAAAEPTRRRRRAGPGMRIVHDDDDIVVVDKPVGVAAHPSVGWTGPTVLGGLAAAGYRISTSGRRERQGIVHRLDVGTSGLMVVAKSERAYSVLKRAFKRAHGRQDLPRAGPGPAGPAARHHRRADRPPPPARLQVRRHRAGQAERHALRGPRGVPARRRWSRCTSRPGAPTRSGCTSRALHHPCVGDLTYGADPTLAARLGLDRQWLHAVRLGFEHPADRPVGRVRERLPGRPGAALEALTANPTRRRATVAAPIMVARRCLVG